MKISTLTTEQALDTLCILTPYIANITGDKALTDALSKKLGKSKMSAAEVYTYGAQKITALVPILLKDHREDVFGILSVLNETTPEEIAEQNVLITINQIKEAVQDKDLVDFFKSWQQEGKTE